MCISEAGCDLARASVTTAGKKGSKIYCSHKIQPRKKGHRPLFYSPTPPATPLNNCLMKIVHLNVVETDANAFSCAYGITLTYNVSPC